MHQLNATDEAISAGNHCAASVTKGLLAHHCALACHQRSSNHMSAQSLLENLLKSGLQMMQGAGSPMPGQGLPSVPSANQAARPNQPAGNAPGSNLRDANLQWGQIGAGAAAGGVLGLLLGSKRGRGLGGKALKVGSVAALGAMAYKAYTAYQEKQAADARAAAAPPPTPAPPLQMVDRVAEPQVEAHSRAMLLAMIAAAKADGHLDDRERGLVEAELQRLEADPGTRQWVEAELRRPLDPAEVARAATTPELAAEMYLASLLMADETNTMERLYLDELARQLKLPEGLKQQLEQQLQKPT
jgi:uncharacterized membrane protein YebE (DUF533 family)